MSSKIEHENSSLKVTVLMTAFNDEKYIGKSIESILNQSYTNFEFVIVNDGSTDSTGSIIEKYAKSDKRIVHVIQKNAGTTIAANNGISIAKGKYIARLDSDDISYPHRLETEVEFLDSNPQVGLVGGGCDLIDTEGNIVGNRNIITNNPAKALLHRNIFQQSDVMLRKDIVVKLGGYREKFNNSQDYDLWIRISEIAEVKKLSTIFGQWRLNPGGYSLARKNEQSDEANLVRKMAMKRRQTGEDNYGEYKINEKPKHRQDIDYNQYEIVIINYLLLSLRTITARKKIIQLINDNGFSFRKILLMFLTFLPKSFLKILFIFRNYLKNNY